MLQYLQKKVFFSLLFFYVFLFYEFIVVILHFRVTLPFHIPVAWFHVSFLYPSVSLVLTPRCVPEPSPTWFSRHFRFLATNSMKTDSFSCFAYQSLNFFLFLSLLRHAFPAIFDFYLQTPWIQVRFLALFSLPVFFYVFFFFYLYLHLYAFFISVFCFFTACLLFLLKLRFLSQKALIFVSTLHVHRFVFLLYLSKWIQVRFPSPSSSMFSFFTSICICMHFFISVFCFLTACSLFLLKLWFLSQKASIFISKLHVHRFVFLLCLSKLKFFFVPEPSPTCFPRHFRFLSPNSMYTGSFSCFLYQNLNFFVFLSLLCRGSPAIFVFLSKKSFDFCLYPCWCGFDVLPFLKKLQFLPQHRYIRHLLCASIFTMIFMENIKTTNEHRFILLLSLSKFKFFCVPQPSPSLLSLGFHAFRVQICVFFLPPFAFVCIFLFWFFVFHCMFIVSSKAVRVLWFFCISVFCFSCALTCDFFISIFCFSLHVHCFF